MFRVIEAHCSDVVASIEPRHVTEYDWLVENLVSVREAEYQHRYRMYWVMNAARLSASYCTEYFRRLEAAAQSMPELGRLALELYEVPAQSNDRQSLQFSFVTKLLHMRDRHLPIYDSLVADFYFFEPERSPDLELRIKHLELFYAFLRYEYARVLVDGLLTRSIAAFRDRFKPVHFTDEKIIDSLIWAFVSKLRRGGLLDGAITYR